MSEFRNEKPVTISDNTTEKTCATTSVLHIRVIISRKNNNVFVSGFRGRLAGILNGASRKEISILRCSFHREV